MLLRATLVILALLFAAPAAAEVTNLRVYSILGESADIAVDGGKMVRLSSNTVTFLRLASGQHSFHLVTDSGAGTTLDATLDDGRMANSNGRSWWCLLISPGDGRDAIDFVLETQDACQRLLDVAPPNDVPEGL